ncbi:UNVERIFIED_CONTAM: hypothetical protein Sradi_3791700 [Sesamum radiatum]|uniref:Transposase n=1 Tax=Sesamum radiatum TaxID=300843 RepID=A0AAW2Q098_SESRA
MSRGRKRVRGTTMGEIMLEVSQNADEVNVSKTTTRHIQTQNRLMPESQTHFSKESYLHLLQEYEHSPNTSRKVLEVKNVSMRNGKLDMKKKGRGAAKLPDEWDSGVKIQVTLNAEGQVVGANTTLPPEAKSVALRQLNDMWRDWKRRLKSDHFTRYIGDVDHDFSELPNEQVELDQWLVLVQYWKHDEVQKQAVQNAESRVKKKYPHRTGKTPFPLLKEKQEFREGLSKRPESEQTKEFKEDLFVNGLGEDPHGRVRCIGRGITRHKLCEISSHNAPTPQMVEQLQELQRLKDDLIHEKKEVELMRLELDNRKEEFFKEKEQIVDQLRRFREELDLMKLNMDFLRL